MSSNGYKERTPYYQDQLFENMTYEQNIPKSNKYAYDPIASISQDGEESKGKQKRK